MRRCGHNRFGVVLLAVAALAVSPAAVAAQGPEDGFDRGNRLYEDGRFAAAVGAYEAVLQSGLINEKLYYNLGNACFRNGDLGRAVLNYERALRLAPGDRDISDNLVFVRSLLTDRMQVPAPPFPFDLLLRLHRSVSIDAETVLFVVLYLVASGFLAARLLDRDRSNRKLMLYGLAIALLICIGVGISLGARIHGLRNRSYAVILAEAVDVRSGPGPEQTVLFTVHEGLKAEIRAGRGGWLQVSLPNGWNGWIPREAVGIV